MKAMVVFYSMYGHDWGARKAIARTHNGAGRGKHLQGGLPCLHHQYDGN